MITLGFGAEGQGDLCFAGHITEINPPRPDLDELVANTRRGDAWLDLSFANGAAAPWMKRLTAHLSPGELSAFAAWNTTGNRLGSLIAHLAIREMPKLQNFRPDADAWYLKSQLLDAYVYCSEVRPRLFQLCERRGLNPWALGAAHREVEAVMQSEIREAATAAGLGQDFSATLPWPRIFEVSVRPAERRL